MMSKQPSTSAVEETCAHCGVGFHGTASTRHWLDGRPYHTDCVDGAHEYMRGKLHGADDLKMSQSHCRDLQRQLNEKSSELGKIKMELHRLAKELGARGLIDLADDLRLAARD